MLTKVARRRLAGGRYALEIGWLTLILCTGCSVSSQKNQTSGASQPGSERPHAIVLDFHEEGDLSLILFQIPAGGAYGIAYKNDFTPTILTGSNFIPQKIVAVVQNQAGALAVLQGQSPGCLISYVITVSRRFDSSALPFGTCGVPLRFLGDRHRLFGLDRTRPFPNVWWYQDGVVYGPVNQGTWSDYPPGAVAAGPYPPGYSPLESDLPTPRHSGSDLVSPAPNIALRNAQVPDAVETMLGREDNELAKIAFVTFFKDYLWYAVLGEEGMAYVVVQWGKDMAWPSAKVTASHIVCGNPSFDAYVRSTFFAFALPVVHQYLECS